MEITGGISRQLFAGLVGTLQLGAIAIKRTRLMPNGDWIVTLESRGGLIRGVIEFQFDAACQQLRMTRKSLFSGRVVAAWSISNFGEIDEVIRLAATEMTAYREDPI